MMSMVEAFPVGGLERLFQLLRDPAPVVVVDLQPERLGAPGDGAADAAHADDAEALVRNAMAEHPGRRPASPFLAADQHRRALQQPPRHGEDQRHGHVGGVFGKHARRIGDRDAARERGGDVDIVDAVAEIGDELEVRAGLRQHGGIDAVGHGRDEHVGGFDRLHELGLRKRAIVDVQPCVEQLAHARLDVIGQAPGDDDKKFLLRHFPP
jgi:hypothetical protein